jgi:ABC-type nickel/cobalt efflux system permease component RcnA
VAGDLSEELRSMIYHSSFSVNAVEMYFKYGSLLACLVLLALFILVFYCRSKIQKSEAKRSKLNLNLNREVLTKLNPTHVNSKSDDRQHNNDGDELEKVINVSV